MARVASPQAPLQPSERQVNTRQHVQAIACPLRGSQSHSAPAPQLSQETEDSSGPHGTMRTAVTHGAPPRSSAPASSTLRARRFSARAKVAETNFEPTTDHAARTDARQEHGSSDADELLFWILEFDNF